jgi:hypothetical protein
MLPVERTGNEKARAKTRGTLMKTIRRSHLARILSDVWCDVVRDSYSKGRLNSEGSLQAAFVSLLDERLRAPDEPERQIFIEPAVRLTSKTPEMPGTLIRPDIVIFNSLEAVCFIELKYMPRALPDTVKDMNSLSAIAGDASVTVTNDRYRGPELKTKVFGVSRSALFVWAGIHKGSAVQLAAWDDPRFEPHGFLQMNAVTQAEQEPDCKFFTDAYKRQRNVDPVE